jgi:hypothetical protein
MTTYLHINGAVSDDWTVEDGPPVVPCWVCGGHMLGKHPSSMKCDEVFILSLTVGEVIGESGELIKQWVLCRADCWDKARAVVAKMVEDSEGQKPIFTHWSADFQERTGLKE